MTTGAQPITMCAGHRLFSRAIIYPVQITARAADARGHAHAQAVRGFQRAAISAHVADSGFGIARDAQRCGEVGRQIKARRRDRHRQAREAAAGALVNSSPWMITSWHAGESTRLGQWDWRWRAPRPRRFLRRRNPCPPRKFSAKRPERRLQREYRSSGRESR